MVSELPASTWVLDEGFITSGYVLCLKNTGVKDTVEISQISYDSVFSREKFQVNCVAWRYQFYLWWWICWVMVENTGAATTWGEGRQKGYFEKSLRRNILNFPLKSKDKIDISSYSKYCLWTEAGPWKVTSP